MESKLVKNKIKNFFPKSKKELADFLGTSRQQIWYSCNTDGINNSKLVEEKIREWIKTK